MIVRLCVCMCVYFVCTCLCLFEVVCVLACEFVRSFVRSFVCFSLGLSLRVFACLRMLFICVFGCWSVCVLSLLVVSLFG